MISRPERTCWLSQKFCPGNFYLPKYSFLLFPSFCFFEAILPFYDKKCRILRHLGCLIMVAMSKRGNSPQCDKNYPTSPVFRMESTILKSGSSIPRLATTSLTTSSITARMYRRRLRPGVSILRGNQHSWSALLRKSMESRLKGSTLRTALISPTLPHPMKLDGKFLLRRFAQGCSVTRITRSALPETGSMF